MCRQWNRQTVGNSEGAHEECLDEPPNISKYAIQTHTVNTIISTTEAQLLPPYALPLTWQYSQEFTWASALTRSSGRFKHTMPMRWICGVEEQVGDEHG
eukprot:1158838-Pelagomonas_calceolata.AAC.7